jgi:hypothetical protein
VPQAVLGPLVHEQRADELDRRYQRQKLRDHTSEAGQLIGREKNSSKHGGREKQREVLGEKVGWLVELQAMMTTKLSAHMVEEIRSDHLGEAGAFFFVKVLCSSVV